MKNYHYIFYHHASKIFAYSILFFTSMFLAGCWKMKPLKPTPVELAQEIATEEFSYSIPSSWKVESRSDEKIATVSPSLLGRISFRKTLIDESIGSVEEYMATIQARYQERFQNTRILKKNVFTTVSGVIGEKSTIETTIDGEKTQLTHYCFQPNEEVIYSFQCIVVGENVKRYEPIFEAVAKSFTLK